MCSLLNKLRKGRSDVEYSNGYNYAKKQHQKFGDSYLIELEAQCYGNNHPFDRGIADYVDEHEPRSLLG